MLINAEIYKFNDRQVAEAETRLLTLRDVARKEPGCRRFDVFRSTDNATYLLYEEWNDRPALDAYFAAEPYKRLALEGILPLAESHQNFMCTPV